MKLVFTKPENAVLAKHAEQISKTHKAFESAVHEAFTEISTYLDLADPKGWVNCEEGDMDFESYSKQHIIQGLKKVIERTLAEQLKQSLES